MKNLLNNRVVQIGITAFAVIAACILFNFCLVKIKFIFAFFGNLIKILMPLIYGLVLAYIMNPLVNVFEEKVFNRINKDTTRRNLSIFCSFVIIVGALVALISFIIPQLLLSIQSVIVNAPTYLKDLGTWIQNTFSSSEVEASILENYDTITEYLTTALNNVVLPMANSAIEKLSTGIVGIFSFIFNFAIGLVFAVYILANTRKFGAGLRKTLYSIFDTNKVNNFIDEVKHINHVFGQFMVGKICDSGTIGLCTLLFLIIFKYPYPLLIAVIICLTDLIPYFGPYIGSIPSVLLILLVDPVKALTFILFMVILQQIDANLITPRIQKQATGLPSFWVLFAITLFGGLFGIIGLLIGVPCFTIIYELCNEHVEKRLKKKNMPVETDYYTKINVVEEKRIKAKIDGKNNL
ncbi:MAG: AI-2E family transporter [Erysipelotrichales bacterium]|nr:AI-2E family transporter [Erysipelotrichales bacterium]